MVDNFTYKDKAAMLFALACIYKEECARAEERRNFEELERLNKLTECAKLLFDDVYDRF